jgi:flavin-dependent dehydrogenase
MADPFILQDGSHIAVVGGGPTGSFFSIFALKMAKMLNKNIRVTIYEPKDFTKDGPLGCNRCGGIISELLVQTLAVEGINLSDRLVQRGINSYKLHTDYGAVSIETPTHEKRIAAVYRGGGPKGTMVREKESFDWFLLNLAKKEGALHVPLKIDHIELRNAKPVLLSREGDVEEADLVVGAIGVKSQTSKLFENMRFGYRRPETVTAAIAEIGFDSDCVSEHFGTSVHLFLLPLKDIKFAAMIPKGTYVTVCILGKNMNVKSVNEFLNHPVVSSVIPGSVSYKIGCRCLPHMNIRAPKMPFTDRVVTCGDAGATRLFKDGLGAAYLMGKAAAKTAVFYGVSARHFQQEYLPVYRSIVNDNRYGQFLFQVTDFFKRYKILTKGMLKVVRLEQEDQYHAKRLSSILWDLFTGNERYKNIFYRTLNFPLQQDLLREITKECLTGEA